MSFRASLEAEPQLSLKEMEEDIQKILEGVESAVPRVDYDFDNNSRVDVFVQTENYNVFLTEENLQFHGISKESVKNEWTVESEEIWEYIESMYLNEGQKYLEDELEWQ